MQHGKECADTDVLDHLVRFPAGFQRHDTFLHDGTDPTSGDRTRRNWLRRPHRSVITDDEQMRKRCNHAAWVRRLVDAAKNGTLLDLREGVPAHLHDPATADQWPADRRIPARVIRDVLTGDHTGFDPQGLRIAGARITGDINFAHITFDFPLEIVQCRIDRTMDLTGVRLRQLTLSETYLPPLKLDGANITGDLVADRIVTNGEISMIGVTIGGQFDLDSARLHHPGRDALSLHNATITGALFARDITTDGAILARDATISRLDFTGAHLRNSGGDALSVDRATITGGLLAERITTDGEIRAIDATCGQLDLTGATLHNPKHHVLALNRATITGGLLAERITTDGQILAIDATISGKLDLTGATLHNPGDNVLALDGASVTGELLVVDADAPLNGTIPQFHADGRISAASTRFENRLDLRGAKSWSTDNAGLEIVLDGAVIRDLTLPADGPASISLSRAKITTLHTPDDQEPQYPVTATGWEIGDVHGHIRTDRAAADRWLNRGQGADASPQPWHALATVYERNGHPAEGRRLRFTAANKVTKATPWRSKLPRWLYRYSAGHGYYPLRAAGWLLAALMAGFVLVDMNRAHFVPTSLSEATTVADTVSGDAAPAEVEHSRTITGADDCAMHPQYPCLDAFSYALTGVVPAATGITRPDWAISTDAPLWVKAGIPVLRIFAWIFTAILLAGVTGLLRKSA